MYPLRFIFHSIYLINEELELLGKEFLSYANIPNLVAWFEHHASS
ncbi:hypothetical protein NIES4101_56350 [Calothrix sp. NIES-4101]|nr:hypothetical protein NIES4101_56350 [Calothrix sp. NIES-4101]